MAVAEPLGGSFIPRRFQETRACSSDCLGAMLHEIPSTLDPPRANRMRPTARSTQGRAAAGGHVPEAGAHASAARRARVTDRRPGDSLGANSPPDVPCFRRVSTDAVAPDSRLDYWQSLFATLRMELPPAARDRNFHAQMLHTTPWRGVTFLHVANTPLTCRFGWRDPNGLVLGCVDRGVVYFRHGRDSATPVNASTGLVLFDQDRPMDAIEPQAFEMTALNLPRALLVAALGSQPVRGDQVIRPFLHPGQLLSGLRQHLRAMAISDTRKQRDITADLAIARSLVMTLLAKRNPNRRRLPAPFDDALLVSARFQLARHVGDFEITPGRVALTLGCSRAHLYRQFAREGDSVAGALREARLYRARDLLTAHTAMPIGEVAWRCGYRDFAAFGRAFRQRFGLTPRDCRHGISPPSP